MRYILFSLFLLLASCGLQWEYSTLNHAGHIDSIYRTYDKVDTISSLSQLRWKFRNDFRFRWDYETYVMSQPLSWYWRPYNRFDLYFSPNWMWNDWAWNHNWWSYRPWWYHNRPWWYYNSWDRPWLDLYTPHNQWFTYPRHSSNIDIVRVNGRRGSRLFDVNSNIEDNISKNRRIRNYPNPNRNINFNNTRVNPRDNDFISRPDFNSNNSNGINRGVRSNPINPPNSLNNNNIRPNRVSPPSNPVRGNISRGSSTSNNSSSRGIRE